MHLLSRAVMIGSAFRHIHLVFMRVSCVQCSGYGRATNRSQRATAHREWTHGGSISECGTGFSYRYSADDGPYPPDS